ncbi:MAG TPA: MBL fold metallo-hydrolase, partial [Actinobacteria bacterium]|nr:MBL fold metallo-hydrolase [Actinomycetota bacterium]
GEQIYRLGTPHHNFYVVTEGGKATVVDAGCSKEWPKLVGGLAAIGLGAEDVEAIVVTHAHADHIGFGREAADATIDVRVHADEEPRALGTFQGRKAAEATDLPLWRIGTWRFLTALIRVGIMSQPVLESVTTMEDGETLDLPGSPTVIHTPGHTEGHVAFHLPRRSVVFTGDGLATRDLFGSNRVSPQMMPDAFHLDPAMARRSLERISGLEADLLLPGHGEPFHGSPAAAVAAAS